MAGGSSNLPTTCGELKELTPSLTPTLTPFKESLNGIFATNRASARSLGAEEVPGSYLLDILLFLASLLANTAGKPNPALPACSGSFTPQTRKRGEGQTLHNPILWPEHLENKMLATTPVSA